MKEILKELYDKKNRGIVVKYYPMKEPIYALDTCYTARNAYNKDKHNADLLLFRMEYQREHFGFTENYSVDSHVCEFSFDGKEVSFRRDLPFATNFSSDYVSEDSMVKNQERYRNYVKHYLPDIDFSKPMTFDEAKEYATKTLKDIFKENGFAISENKIEDKSFNKEPETKERFRMNKRTRDLVSKDVLRGKKKEKEQAVVNELN